MLRSLVIGLTTLLIGASSLAYAQQAGAPAQEAQEHLSPADRKALTDMRIAVLKAALQLKPDQEKYWPAVEDAIRAKANMREQRLAALQALVEKDVEPQPMDLLRARADALTKKADALRKLVDSWQPLYASLDEDQKRRVRFLVEHVLYLATQAIEIRRMQNDEDEED